MTRFSVTELFSDPANVSSKFRVYTCVLTGLLLGCAVSPEQFANYSVEQRVSAICENSDSKRERVEKLAQLMKGTIKHQTHLAQGYRIVQQCEVVEVESPVCAGFKDKVKQGCMPWREKRCVDVKQAINVSSEQASLNYYKSEYARNYAADVAQGAFCRKAVRNMPVTNAYRYFSSRSEPTPQSYAVRDPANERRDRCSGVATARDIGIEQQQITFVNDIPDRHLTVSYVQPDGHRTAMKDLNFGQKVRFDSLVGHVFVVTDKRVGSCIGWHRVSRETPMVFLTDLR